MPKPDDPQEDFDLEEEEEELEDFEDFEAFEDHDAPTSADVTEAVSQITERVLDTIESATAVRGGFFFPKGIELIEVAVDIAGVKASVKIAGPGGN